MFFAIKQKERSVFPKLFKSYKISQIGVINLKICLWKYQNDRKIIDFFLNLIAYKLEFQLFISNFEKLIQTNKQYENKV